MKTKEIMVLSGFLFLIVLFGQDLTIQERRHLLTNSNYSFVFLQYENKTKYEVFMQGEKNLLRIIFNSNYNTFLLDNSVIAKDRWYVEYEKEWEDLKNVKNVFDCYQIVSNKCYMRYYFKSLSFSKSNYLIKPEYNETDFKIVKKAGGKEFDLETVHYFRNGTTYEEFPYKYLVSLSPKKPEKNYRLIWQVEDLSNNMNYSDGIYNPKKYNLFIFDKVKINLSNRFFDVDYITIDKKKNSTKVIFKVFFNKTTQPKTYEVGIQDPSSNINLFLDNSESNRTYELGSNIQVHYNSSESEIICVDIDQSEGLNISCKTEANQGFFNWSLSHISKRIFDLGTRTRTMLNSGNISIIQSSVYDELQNFSMVVNSSSELENVSFDIGNDNQKEMVLFGKLGSSYLRIDTFLGGDISSRDSLASTSSSLLKFLRFPGISGWLYSWVVKISGEKYIGDYVLNFSTEEYKDSVNTGATWNTTAQQLHMTPNIKPWLNDGYVAESSNPGGMSIYDAANCDGITLTAYSEWSPISPDAVSEYCGHDSDTTTYTWNRWGDAGSAVHGRGLFYFSSGGFGSSSLVNLKYRLYCALPGASSGYTREVLVNLSIYDNVGGKWDTINQCQFICSNCGTGNEYDSGVTTVSYDLSAYPKYLNASGYVRFRVLENRQEDGCGPCNELGWVNLYDVGSVSYSQYDTRNMQNTTTRSLFTSDATLTNLTIYINTTNQTTNNITSFISVNDGTNYETVQYLDKQYQHNFTSNFGSVIKMKMNLGTNNRFNRSAINYAVFYNLTGTYPENISIDFGDDGTYDVINNSELNETTRTWIVTSNVSNVFSNYFEEECENTEVNGCLFPLRIRSGTAGIVNLSINATTLNQTGPTVVGFFLNITEAKAHCTTHPCNITINTTYQSTGTLNLGTPELTYFGDGNYSITAHNLSNTDVENLTIFIVYSPINVSFPSKIDEYFLTPTNNNQKNVSPYGQSKTIPIFNITKKISGKTYNYDLYSLINQSLNISNCQNLQIQFYNVSNYSGGISINNTPKAIKTNTTISPIWNLVSFTNCSIIDFYLWDFNFEFRPKCPLCVLTSDYGG